TTRINADSLLMEGARRVDELSLIEKKIPSRDLVFAVNRDPSEEEDVELSEAEAKVFPLVDGQRTVKEILEESGLVEFEGMKALFGLIQAGFVAQAGERPSEEEEESEAGMAEHLNLAEAFYRSGMMEDAAREYRAVLEFDEENPDARLRLGCIALRAGVPEEALGHFDAMAERARRSYVRLRNRSLALEELGRYEEAMESLMDAESSRPGDRGALLHRGIVLLKAGRAAQASEIFERYRKKIGDRTPPPIYYAYAVLAASLTGDLDRAAAVGREGLSHYDDHGAILVNTGVTLAQKREPDAAEAFFLRAVKSAPSTPAQAHKNLGDAAYSRGDADGARAHYERAVKIDPRLGDQVYQRLGEIAYTEDDQDLALLLWQRALELNPENEKVRAGLEALSATPGG
ncbi:MAG: tetratricopeptide repeat protein, partial [Longimicrobiales bacterium]|nr:tetratricopeptide repeat protein [Longimicrobiales bacterium]